MDPTTSDLQAQLDRLSLTVQVGRESKGAFEPASQQLARLAERCHEILTSWAEADALHAHVVNEAEMRLTEWGAIENRLEQDYSKRLRELEEAIGSEWQALRRIHEEPVKELRQEAAALSDVAVSAANLALQGFERAEARLEAFEANVQSQLTRLSEDMHATLAEHRRAMAAPALAEANVTPFPLEGVMRIHDDLRDGPPIGDDAPGSLSIVARQPHESHETSEILSARIESLEREVTSERQEVRDTTSLAEKLGRTGRVAVGALAFAIVGVAIVAIFAQRNMNARLDEAAARVAAAERQAAAATAANQQLAATRADAQREIAQARQAAAEAGIVGSVLVAPDVVRFSLTGTEKAARANAQVFWSRSRGLVVSAAQLPPLSAGTTYQIWLLSESGPTSAGTMTPDASGRASLSVENPPNLPRAVNGVNVTLESGGPQATPSSSLVLVRIQQ